MNDPYPTRPMHLPLSLVVFGGPMLLFLAMQRFVAPALDAAGVPPITNFYVVMSPHLLFFFGALFACRSEGYPLGGRSMIERLRLQVPRGRMWGWMVLAAVGNVGLYMLTYVAARPVLQWLYDLWPEPAVMDRIFGDSGTFAGYPLAGNGWILGAFLVAFFFNVMGEELWWRGYVFPRQELVHSERTWLVHGLLWAAFHLFAPYNALMVLPGALFVSWIYQKQRNTWVFVAAHGALNAMAMIRLVKGVLG